MTSSRLYVIVIPATAKSAFFNKTFTNDYSFEVACKMQVQLMFKKE